MAVKIQRSGLKELFDVDLKNLKKLATLLNNFDPKTDGADRNWVKIYEEVREYEERSQRPMMKLCNCAATCQPSQSNNKGDSLRSSLCSR